MLKKSATLAVTSVGLLVALFLPAVPSLAGCTPIAGPEAESATPAAGGASACTKDTDCRGDRICTNGACVDPNGGAARESTPAPHKK